MGVFGNCLFGLYQPDDSLFFGNECLCSITSRVVLPSLLEFRIDLKRKIARLNTTYFLLAKASSTCLLAAFYGF